MVYHPDFMVNVDPTVSLLHCAKGDGRIPNYTPVLGSTSISQTVAIKFGSGRHESNHPLCGGQRTYIQNSKVRLGRIPDDRGYGDASPLLGQSGHNGPLNKFCS